MSAPRWAGFLALANEQSNGAPIGFLNPAIYRIGLSAGYGAAFHDISSGSNDNGLGETYNAVVGYDLVTGWGSPNGQSLLNGLGPVYTGPNFSLTPSPATIDITAGSTGTSNITLSPSNGFTGTVDLNGDGSRPAPGCYGQPEPDIADRFRRLHSKCRDNQFNSGWKLSHCCDRHGFRLDSDGLRDAGVAGFLAHGAG